MDNNKELTKLIDERIAKIVPTYMKSRAFTDRKLTDTPLDALQVVSRKYVNLSGLAANRPVSSVATIGQKYFATDTNMPMTYGPAGWVNGIGSIVALNN